MGGGREPRDWGAFEVSKEATQMQEESPGQRKAPLAHASEQTPAVRGASRGSVEQRRTEQSWRTGKRQRRTEQRQQRDRDTALSNLAADGAADAGSRQQSPRWQEGEQLPSVCARSSPRQAATGSRIPVSMQLLPPLEPPPLEVQNAALGRGVVSHPAFTRCRISKGSLEAKPARHAARLAVRMRSGCCHLHVGSSFGAGKEGSSERPSCVRCPSSHAGPTIPLLQGLPSVTPDGSSVLRGRKTPPRSPTAWQGAPEVREQTKKCSAVLSCGSHSGVGNGKASTGNLFLFLPSPSPSEMFCARFFPALQADGVSSPVDVKSRIVSVMLSDWGGCCPVLPGRAQSGRIVHRARVWAWGGHGDSEYSRTPSSRVHLSSLPCAPGQAVLLWHREREGLTNRIRSCGTS